MSSNSFNIDFQRTERLGFPEVVYGKSKSTKQLLDILRHYRDNGQSALATKVQEEKAVELLKTFPDALYDKESEIFALDLNESGLSTDDVAIVSGGTSDEYVVNEIYYTLMHLGKGSERIMDVGVSGLHRLLNRIEDLKKYKVVIAVAGFEAALPTVLGGLLPQPIIAVPTSVGYGISEGGQVALNSLLASCANGITVVNIDNGYGAAVAAFRILNALNNKSE
ncbi:MAG: nickel pincer cofactor biosynthesis protein LarB [Cyclobacteriaceae bacterium]